MLKKILLTTILLCVTFVQAHAQTQYPDKPVTIVVPVGPGGGIDVVSRTIAHRLSEIWNQPVVVVNKPGGNSTMGTGLVTKSPNDGYTLLSITSVTLSVPATVLKETVSYQWDKDLIPVSHLGRSPPFVVAVNSKLGIKNFQDLKNHGQNKKFVSYASAGIGDPFHIYGSLLLSGLKLNGVHVPYKSGQAAVTDVLSGNVDMIVSSPAAILPHVQSGTLTAISIVGNESSDDFPGVMPLSKSEFKSFPDLYVDHALWAPSGTPDWILAKLRKDVSQALVLASNDLINRKYFDSKLKTLLTPEKLIADGKLWIKMAESVVRENQ
jgi:tripartite-type tricarboxylate transporter receptor subunit TctC